MKRAKETDDALLKRIWRNQAETIASILETTKPEDMQAATLSAVNKFLSENGISADTFNAGRDREAVMAGVAAQIAALPKSEDEEDESAVPRVGYADEPLPAPSFSPVLDRQ